MHFYKKVISPYFTNIKNADTCKADRTNKINLSTLN